MLWTNQDFMVHVTGVWNTAQLRCGCPQNLLWIISIRACPRPWTGGKYGKLSLRIQVCPKKRITPIHSYSFRMGLEPEKSYSIRRSGFLGCFSHFYEGRQPKESMQRWQFQILVFFHRSPLRKLPIITPCKGEKTRKTNPLCSVSLSFYHPQRKGSFVFQASAGIQGQAVKLPGCMRSQFSTGLNLIFLHCMVILSLEPVFRFKKNVQRFK